MDKKMSEIGLMRHLHERNKLAAKPECPDCPNCPNQGWYAVQYTHADGTLDQCQQQCEWCYTIPNSKFNQNH